jgi:predicted esterase
VLRGLLVVAVVFVVAAAITTRFLRRAAALMPDLDPARDGGAPEDETTAIAWCADGLQPIAGGGCLALPADTGASGTPAPLLIYLHGIYEQDHPDEELDRQHRVAARATARGFAVLALRSGVGVCHPGVADFATRFCWPSNEQVADRAREFVDGWTTALGATERRVGRGPRTVLGFSSGGYFAALLAARSLFAADTFVVAHGGPVEPIHGGGPGRPPLLLLSADDDVAQGEMVRLDDELTREGWPHDHRAREGAHGLTDGDIDVALSFATRTPREGLPLRPALAGHAPRWREREAAAEEAAGAVDDAGEPGEPTEQQGGRGGDEDSAPPGTNELDAAPAGSPPPDRDGDTPSASLIAPGEAGTSADPAGSPP